MEQRILEITENQANYQKSVESIHGKFDELAEILQNKNKS
jgi:hypothetical protein